MKTYLLSASLLITTVAHCPITSPKPKEEQEVSCVSKFTQCLTAIVTIIVDNPDMENFYQNPTKNTFFEEKPQRLNVKKNQ